jgi:hypothetical protein
MRARAGRGKVRTASSASLKRTAARAKAPAPGKTRRAITQPKPKSNLTGKRSGKKKVPQTKVSKPTPKPFSRAASLEGRPVGDLFSALSDFSKRPPLKGKKVGNKGVIRFGPDLRTAEEKRNPRRVRKD